MIIHVTKKELEAFLPLIPADMQEQLWDEEWFCLGALSEPEDGESTAAGVLIFSAEDGVSGDGESLAVLKLQWLYVAPQFRMRGYANELMRELSEVLEDNPADGMICDIPFDSRYDLAEAFFVSWGFYFEVIDDQQMIITKEDFRRKIIAMGKEKQADDPDAIAKPDGLYPVSDIPQERFEEAVRMAKATAASGYYDHISEAREDYADDVSSVMLKDNEITSLILFERLANGDLHMVMLAARSQKEARELLDLIHYAAGYCYQNYPEDAKVELTLGSERGRKLAEHLFPDKDPVRIRRGCFY